jgi:hypothetical protein
MLIRRHLLFATFTAVSVTSHVLEAAPADTHHQKHTAEQALEKCTDVDMITLMTTVQQIMTGLQTAATEEQFMVWLCRTNGHKHRTIGIPVLV